jgi:hypothetical protein
MNIRKMSRDIAFVYQLIFLSITLSNFRLIKFFIHEVVSYDQEFIKLQSLHED